MKPTAPRLEQLPPMRPCSSEGCDPDESVEDNRSADGGSPVLRAALEFASGDALGGEPVRHKH